MSHAATFPLSYFNGREVYNVVSNVDHSSKLSSSTTDHEGLDLVPGLTLDFLTQIQHKENGRDSSLHTTIIYKATHSYMH